MKKLFTTVALLGFYAPLAFAQTPSSVELYGVIDEYVEFANNGVDSSTRLQSGGIFGSRLGFRGTEHLGNGLKALFTLESGVNADNGSLGQGGLLFGRQVFVGLGSDLGTVTFGRQLSPFFFNLATYGLGGGMGWGNASNYFTDGSVLRLNNSIVYAAPKLAGVAIRGAYALGENAAPGQSTVGNVANISGQYDAGPFSVNATYLRRKTSNANADKWSAIGVSYDFRVVKTGLLYQKRSDDANVADNNYFEISATVPLNNASVLVDYGQFKNKVVGNGDAKVLSVRYDQYLSKRTTLYAGAAKMRNDAGAAFGFNGATGVAMPVTAGNDPRSIIAGIRHTF